MKGDILDKGDILGQGLRRTVSPPPPPPRQINTLYPLEWVESVAAPGLPCPVTYFTVLGHQAQNFRVVLDFFLSIFSP